MQAPTTSDGGTAGRDPQQRTCPGCAAENPLAASFCWRCYRAFEPVGVSRVAWPSPPTRWPPEPMTTPATADTSGSRIGVLAALVTITLGVVATIAFVALREPGVSFPDSVSGLERISTDQTEAAVDSLRAASEADGLDADMAFYGSGSMPEAALMWVRGAGSTPGGPSEAFDTFAEGFTSGYSGTLVTSGRTERTTDGVTYVCAPVTGSVGAGICMWEEEDVFWILLDVRPGARIGETNDLAVSAHEAAA